MIGKQLGHYKIESQIGRGGMATVYLAEQTGLDRRVALKLLHPSLAADEIIVQRFQQEARIAANLQHPHIVTIYDVGEADNIYYIAMRFIEGETLGHLLHHEGPLTPTRAVAMLAQVADALDFAHAHGVLHRDIKPANVMVEPGDLLTLTDFGIARAGERSQLTATRMVIGTPEYMSPEQARGGTVDKRSDLYSLGILLYEMLGGRPPFSAASTPSLLYLHIHEPPPPLDQLRPELPPALCDVVSRALSKDPAQRFQSGAALVAAARAALAVRPAPAPTSTVAEKVTAGAPAVTAVAPPPPWTPPAPVPAVPSPPIPSAGTAVLTPPSAGRSGLDTAPADTWPLARAPAPSPGDRSVAPGAATMPQGPIAHDTGRAGPGAWLLGPAIVAIALMVVGLLVVTQTDLLERTSPTPTVVAARPTASATAIPTAVPPPTALPPTAAPAPTAPPPTAAPAPTAPPPTPGPSDRLTAAQSAVSAGDFAPAIADLEAVRQDPMVQADPQLRAMADESLRTAHVLYGNQLLERGQLDASYAQFGEALKLAPNDPAASDGQKRVILTKNYGIMEAAWGKDDNRAIQALEENMILDPGYRDTRQKLYALLIGKADRLLAAGDRDGAFPALMRALEVVPDGPEARQRLTPYTPTPVPPPTAPPYVPPPTQRPYVPPTQRPYVPPPTQPPYVPPPGPFVPPGSPV